MRIVNRLCIGLAVHCVAHSVCGITAFYYSSAPTDRVGGGVTRTITPADGFDFVGTNVQSRTNVYADLQLQVRELHGSSPTNPIPEEWTFDFREPNTTTVKLGTFANAVSSSLSPAGQPQMAVDSSVGSSPNLDGPSYPNLSGQFQVLDFALNSNGTFSRSLLIFWNSMH